MTVENQLPIQHFTANGIATTFTINFAVEGKDNIKVTANDEVVTIEDYSYDSLTKAVVFNTAPIANTEIKIERLTSIDRSITYATYNNSFRPETLNYDLDRIWRVLQEQNIVDAEVLCRIKDEIEWRRTHDFNYDELAQVREKQIFDSLKGYTDTLVASVNPGIFEGVAAGVVFAQDGKSIQTHILDILKALEANRNTLKATEIKLASDIQAEEDRAKAEEQQLQVKIHNEIDRAKDVEESLQLQITTSNAGVKYFETQAELLAFTPTEIDPKQAYAFDTGKNYLWNGSWKDEGRSVLDQAKDFANANALFKPIRLDGTRHHTSITEAGHFHIPTGGIATNIGLPEPSIGILFSSGKSWGDAGNVYHIFTTNLGTTYVNTLDSVAGNVWLGWKTREDFKIINGSPDLNTDLQEGNNYIGGALFATAEKGYPFQKAGYLIRKKNSSDYYNQTYITEDGIAVRYGLLNPQTNKPEYGNWRGIKFPNQIIDISNIAPSLVNPGRLDGIRHHTLITEPGHFHVPTTAVANTIGMPLAAVGMLFSSGYSWGGYTGNIYHTFTTNQGEIYVNTYDNSLTAWTGWVSQTSKIPLIDSKIQQVMANLDSLKDNGFTNKFTVALEKGQVYQTKSGAIKDSANRYDYFSCWGSSTIELMGSKLKAMANGYGITNTLEEGKGSEIAETIGVRFGSKQLIISPVTIPTSGFIAIRTNLPTVTNLWYIKRFKVNLGGILGDIYWNDSTLVFERDQSGEAVAITTDTVATPIINTKFREGILVLNIGKNNLTSDSNLINDPVSVFNETVAFIDHVRSFFKKVIILDQYVDVNTAKESPVRERIMIYNALIKEKYGDLVLDVYDYLKDQAFIDNNLNKTQADIDQIALGNLPQTWARDTWHINETAETLIINKLIKPKLEQLEWVSA